MKSLLRKWIQTLIAAAFGASTSSVATAALLAGGHVLVNGLLFIGLGTVVIIAACAAGEAS
jgi:hypothetical protein